MEYGAISVIIQGPIDWTTDVVSLQGTTLALSKSIRKFLPGAEIIISTWIDENVEGLEYDRVIFSELPPSQGDWPGFVASNVNRQIVSTSAGLNASTRQYALKIRSDMVLEGVDFISIFESRCAEVFLDRCCGAIFELPIVANNFSSRNTAAILARLPDHPLPLHPSDHLQFGLRRDLATLWNVQLQTDQDSYYFLDRSHPNRWRLGELSRLAPEQHIFVNALGKFREVPLEHYADDRPEIIELSKYYMNTHFVFMDDRAIPVRFAKYHTPHHFSFDWMRMCHVDFVEKKQEMEHSKLRRSLQKVIKKAASVVHRGVKLRIKLS